MDEVLDYLVHTYDRHMTFEAGIGYLDMTAWALEVAQEYGLVDADDEPLEEVYALVDEARAYVYCT